MYKIMKKGSNKKKQRFISENALLENNIVKFNDKDYNLNDNFDFSLGIEKGSKSINVKVDFKPLIKEVVNKINQALISNPEEFLFVKTEESYKKTVESGEIDSSEALKFYADSHKAYTYPSKDLGFEEFKEISTKEIAEMRAKLMLFYIKNYLNEKLRESIKEFSEEAMIFAERSLIDSMNRIQPESIVYLAVEYTCGSSKIEEINKIEDIENRNILLNNYVENYLANELKEEILQERIFKNSLKNTKDRIELIKHSIAGPCKKLEANEQKKLIAKTYEEISSFQKDISSLIKILKKQNYTITDEPTLIDLTNKIMAKNPFRDVPHFSNFKDVFIKEFIKEIKKLKENNENNIEKLLNNLEFIDIIKIALVKAFLKVPPYHSDKVVVNNQGFDLSYNTLAKYIKEGKHLLKENTVKTQHN